ncbi:MAG: molybdopterin cofactor-binding domain-containing protein [Alphaproteobacteria bacterium]
MATNPSLTKQPRVDAWISLAQDGRVLVRSGKVDIGQRISDAILRIAADELDVDPARVVVEARRTGVSPDEGVTSGSNSMEESGTAMRLAAATLRRELVARAAAAFGVAV